MIEDKKPLLGLNTNELKEVARELGMPSFASRQMANWIYVHNVTDVQQMTNLSVNNRQKLADSYCVGAAAPVERMESKDGTVKYLFPVRGERCEVRGEKYVETVFIPDGERGTVCVSCQVGCKMNCKFCQTGRQGFHGNLTPADILNQIYSLPERERLTNIVFMGQGEPMDNYDAVLKATQILTAPDGYAWSPRRITVSSVGVMKGLRRFLDESDCHVAISMHAPSHELRRSLMPAEEAWPIAAVVDLLRQYDFTGQRRCSFEYICFAGLNDTLSHGREIVRLVQGLECRVNLIRFHAIPDAGLPGSDERRMEQLRDFLTSHGVYTTIRASRGEDILAACGLLSTLNVKH